MKNLRGEKEAYEALIADGGQPSHPFSLGFDVLRDPGQYKDILWFWHALSDGGGFEQEFRHQLIVWKEFRQFQERMRHFYIPRNRFQEYENAIRESSEDAQCKWDIQLHEDRLKQNRLEDWNEFRYLHNRKLKARRRQVPPVEKEFFGYWKQLEDIESSLGGIPPLPGRPPGENVIDAEKRRQDARRRVKAAERKLQQARSECSTASLESAQNELELAQEITRLQNNISGARRDYGRELHEVEEYEVFMKWIDDQYSAIALECGYTTDNFTTLTNISTHSKGRKPPSRRHTRSQSVLRPDPSSKISKPTKTKVNQRRKAKVMSSEEPQAMTATAACPVESHITTPWSGRLRQSRSGRPSTGPQVIDLGPARPSRISKSKRLLQLNKGRDFSASQSRNRHPILKVSQSPELTSRSQPNRRINLLERKGSTGDLIHSRRSRRIAAQQAKLGPHFSNTDHNETSEG